MSSFSQLHPAVSTLYFISVLGFTMFLSNPMLLIISLMGSVLFFVIFRKNGHMAREFGFTAVLVLLICITNPLFSHSGVTPLLYLNSNPVTLEAILYGANLAVMLAGVIFWFKCFTLVMTDDKLLYLFGKISPKISLLICSALRFIPLLKSQAARIRHSQKAMGLYSADTWTDRLKGVLRVFSALISWSLENAVDTGASMKARGYGLPGLTHYSLFKFRKTDAAAMAVIAVFDAVIILVLATGQLDFSFYPFLQYRSMNIYGAVAIALFAALCLLPVIIQIKEVLAWKYYRSKI